MWERIYYIAQKGIPVKKYYSQDRASNPIKKDFDLCDSCEKEFREWLNTKPLPDIKKTINRFERYEE